MKLILHDLTSEQCSDLGLNAIPPNEYLLIDSTQMNHYSVYVVSNLGFYEAEQIKHLLDIVRNWCVKMGCTYGGGLAVGAGPMVKSIQKLPFEKTLNKDVWCGISRLATAMKNKEKIENYYTKTLIPRAVYLKAAHMTFHKSLKENNLERNGVR